jgi:hypothetical protein
LAILFICSVAAGKHGFNAPCSEICYLVVHER